MYKEKFTFKNCDFSLNDKVKPHSILEACEEIAGRDACDAGCGYHELMARNLAWVIVRTKVVILKDLENGKDAYIETYSNTPGRIDFDRNYIITNLNDEICIKAITKWIIIDYATRRIVRSSEAKFPSDKISDIKVIDDLKKVNFEDTKLTLSKETKVCLNDLDHNGHMNNCRYMEFIYNTFDFNEKRHLHSFECEYVKEVKYGENITIKYDTEYSHYKIYNSNNELSFVCLIDWR